MKLYIAIAIYNYTSYNYI